MILTRKFYEIVKKINKQGLSYIFFTSTRMFWSTIKLLTVVILWKLKKIEQNQTEYIFIERNAL